MRSWPFLEKGSYDIRGKNRQILQELRHFSGEGNHLVHLFIDAETKYYNRDSRSPPTKAILADRQVHKGFHYLIQRKTDRSFVSQQLASYKRQVMTNQPKSCQHLWIDVYGGNR
ncbi:hypothetical protein TNCT_694411 [Trichonephila clavata]|uniref:Uncharacterized protein n=1 Tax=Trichonephila clavata TaxID=2740835 RepID=A0A8X6KCG3_TRICU|nr:hypothetical protein TNCT_694411 [Trichonephila clavata]